MLLGCSNTRTVFQFVQTDHFHVFEREVVGTNLWVKGKLSSVNLALGKPLIWSDPSTLEKGQGSDSVQGNNDGKICS